MELGRGVLSRDGAPIDWRRVRERSGRRGRGSSTRRLWRQVSTPVADQAQVRPRQLFSRQPKHSSCQLTFSETVAAKARHNRGGPILILDRTSSTELRHGSRPSNHQVEPASSYEAMIARSWSVFSPEVSPD